MFRMSVLIAVAILTVAAAGKGFGAAITSSPKIQRSAMPATNARQTTEQTIQQRIDMFPGLREAMDLDRELKSWNAQLAGMSFVDHTLIPQRVLEGMRAKEERLGMLQGQAGWTCRAVRNKVQQITWDTTAAQRESRHANAVLPSEMENYMHSVATLVSRGGRHGDVLDVGCGTGLIFSFLEKVCGDGGKGRGKGKGKAKGKDNNVDGGVDAGLGGFEQGRLVGIDLSAEMLNIAQASFPSAQFVQGDYLDYDCDTGRFDSIVFNECLHYFEDQQEAIEKAVRLCKPAGAHGVSKIVISHPRGMKNVRLLNQHNQLMVPSLLPTVDELQQIIDTLSSQLGTSLRLATAPHCDSTHYLAVIELA